MIVTGEPAVYHVMSRTVLDGFVLGDVEKEYLLKLIKHLSAVYFTEVLGFCLMGNHFHLLVKMIPEYDYSDDQIKRRYARYWENGKELGDDQIPMLRRKWSSLSEYMKEVKQTFSRYYNKTYRRRGFFWSDRYKSLIVEKGETLINCLAYIDLNPVRAGIVDKPEDYRWNSLGYHIQANNKDGFLSTDFGLKEFSVKSEEERIRRYREYVYETGAIPTDGKPYTKTIPEKIVTGERKRHFEISRTNRFLYRTRYFTDSGIIGSREYVSGIYQQFKHLFQSKHEKKPKSVKGLEGVFSLKRLSELI
jgi:REP element-mobilizing transposase RayT